MLVKKKAELAGELVLLRDPRLVGRWAEGKDSLAANGRCGVAGEKYQQRFPLERRRVGVFDKRRDGVKQGHGTAFSLAGLGWW